MAELSYNEELRERTTRQFAGEPAERVNAIYAFTKGVALESFRNGLAAGKARSASRMRSAREATR